MLHQHSVIVKSKNLSVSTHMQTICTNYIITHQGLRYKFARMVIQNPGSLGDKVPKCGPGPKPQYGGLKASTPELS